MAPDTLESLSEMKKVNILIPRVEGIARGCINRLKTEANSTYDTDWILV